MPLSGFDISWDVLREIVRRWGGADAELCEFTPLEGGSISTTLALTVADHRSATRKVVLKISPHRVDHTHADEALQLGLLKEAGMPVPQVFGWQVGTLDSPFSYILMEFVDGVDLSAAKSSCPPEQFDAIQEHLAELLLRLHACAGSEYRCVSSQETQTYDAWPAFYQAIFEPVWQEVARAEVLPVKCRKLVAKLHDRLDRYLPSDGEPRLLHWDVWSTNLLARCDHELQWRISALLDPDCKYGHPEAELAYIELFHTSTPVFMKAYQRDHRLPQDYFQVRRPIYQLYSLLSHLQFFGPEYLKPALAAIDKVGHLL